MVSVHQTPTTMAGSFSHSHMEQKLQRIQEEAPDELQFLYKWAILRSKWSGVGDKILISVTRVL